MGKPYEGQAVLKGIVTPQQFEHFKRDLLRKMDELIEKTEQSKEWLTTEEACEYLRIGETKLYNLVRDGTIQKNKIGGSNRYKIDELRQAVLDDSLQ